MYALNFRSLHHFIQRNRSYIYIIYIYITWIYDIHDYFLQTVFRLCDLNYTIKMLMTVIFNDISVIFYVDKIHKLHVHVFTDFISFQVTAR